MMRKVTTTLCTACLLLAAATQGFGQSRTPAAKAVAGSPRPLILADEAAPAQAAMFDATLLYYQLGNPIFDVNLGDNGQGLDFQAAGLFFTAPFDGTVDRVDFELSDFFPSPGVAGTGAVRIKMVPGVALPDTPQEPGVDSLDVDFSLLAARSFIGNELVNQIDVTSRNFEVEEGEEYYMQFSLVNPSADAALTFVFDRGSADTTDTRYFDSGLQARSWLYIDDGTCEDVGCYSFVDDPNNARTNSNVLVQIQLTMAPPPPPPTTASMQFIHNAPGAGVVDIYVGDSLEVDDLGFQEATPFVQVLAGEQTIDVVAGGDPDNSNPVFSTTAMIAENRSHWAFALGRPGQDLNVKLEQTRGESGEEGKVPLLFMHGGYVDGAAGAVDFRTLDTTSEHGVLEVLVDDLGFGQLVGPVAVNPEVFNLEVSTADNSAQVDVFTLDVEDTGGFGGGALLLLTSGVLDGDPPFGLFGVRTTGEVFFPLVSTATETTDLPASFVLHGNYPNPFNPETTIRFDVKERTRVRLQVFNVLGQVVETLVDEELTPGSYRSVFEAAALPSGSYFYRLEAGAFRATRPMMLLK